MTTWAIIPVKPLRDGKSRLAHLLSSNERAELTTNMLRRTLEVLNDVTDVFRTLVVSRDPAVLKTARQYDAFTFGEGEDLGLNVGLTRGAHMAAAQQAASILILPVDLPLITAGDVETVLDSTAPPGGVRRILSRFTGFNGAGGSNHARVMAICPDRLEDGTNALYLSSPLGFSFQYGPGSYHRHLQEAERLGMKYHIVHSPGLKFDLDTEEDWYKYLALGGELAPRSAVMKTAR